MCIFTSGFSLEGMHARGRGCSTGLAGKRRGAISARASSERRVRSIGSQKHGNDKRLVITRSRACCIDDPWTAASIKSVIALLEKLRIAWFRSCFFVWSWRAWPAAFPSCIAKGRFCGFFIKTRPGWVSLHGRDVCSSRACSRR